MERQRRDFKLSIIVVAEKESFGESQGGGLRRRGLDYRVERGKQKKTFKWAKGRLGDG
jgi:hypothetical protein